MNLADSLHLIGMETGPSARQCRLLDRLPQSWRTPVWQKVQRLEARHQWYPEWKAREGSEYLNSLVDELDANPVKVDDDADDISRRADTFARLAEANSRRHADPEAARIDLESLCCRWGLQPPATSMPTKAAIARMIDAQWSRRQFKRQHERALEAYAIGLGLVHRRASIYLSTEALKRFKARQIAAAAMLDETTATNEAGEEFTLAELAALGISNKKNRRAELMTRLRGCEDMAKLAGHAAEFVTITAPSRMHARSWIDGEANPHHDGTTPRQAHEYLQHLWTLIRSKLDRLGVRVYGVRIAEPHHDGCPHWHLLLFVDSAHVATLRAVVTEYALRDSPDEAGAATQRVKFKAIDPTKGSAVGYVAKYIAKSIDGFGLERDLEGVPARNAAERVTAWASLHGIRQFQFIGGPPVGLWRELRRIPAEVAKNAPPMVRDAWQAAQRMKREDVPGDLDDGAAELFGTGEGQDDKRADYGEFLKIIGGPQQRRKDYPLRVAKQWTDSEGRYGEETGWKPFGVTLTDDPTKVYTSTRHTWTLNGRKTSTTSRRASTPWTRVNNCTGQGREGDETARSILFGEEVAAPSPAMLAGYSTEGARQRAAAQMADSLDAAAAGDPARLLGSPETDPQAPPGQRWRSATARQRDNYMRMLDQLGTSGPATKRGPA